MVGGRDPGRGGGGEGRGGEEIQGGGEKRSGSGEGAVLATAKTSLGVGGEEIGGERKAPSPAAGCSVGLKTSC